MNNEDKALKFAKDSLQYAHCVASDVSLQAVKDAYRAVERIALASDDVDEAAEAHHFLHPDR